MEREYPAAIVDFPFFRQDWGLSVIRAPAYEWIVQETARAYEIGKARVSPPPSTAVLANLINGFYHRR